MKTMMRAAAGAGATLLMAASAAAFEWGIIHVSPALLLLLAAVLVIVGGAIVLGLAVINLGHQLIRYRDNRAVPEVLGIPRPPGTARATPPSPPPAA